MFSPCLYAPSTSALDLFFLFVLSQADLFLFYFLETYLYSNEIEKKKCGFGWESQEDL